MRRTPFVSMSWPNVDTGWLRVPALVDEPCPKCGAVNDDTRFSVFRVSDRRGLSFECDCCAHSWPSRGVAGPGVVPGV